MEAALTRIILDPRYHDILGILKGARNGLVYGARVRGPHALVMTILFGNGSWQKRAKHVYKATKQHALNLSKFVAIYKTVLLVQKTLAGGKVRESDPFFAGLVGGYYVFGERNAVNEQIVLYVVSRVITSFLPRAGPPVAPSPLSSLTDANGLAFPPGAPYPKPRPPNSKVFELYAALTWGAVMYLFRERRDTLQGGMISSMQYLYLDSEVWSSLRNLVWPNKPKPSIWAKKGTGTDADGAGSSGAGGTGGQGFGNVLESVTLPPPDLSGVPLFQPESVTPAAVGEVRAYSPQALNLFKAFTIPSLLQKEFSFTQSPCTVVRAVTLTAAALLDAGKMLPSRESRHILAGPAGSGKSVLLLQSTTYAQATGWIVLYFPSATPLVNSSSPHSYSPTQAIFQQPTLASQLLTRFSTANRAAFKALKTSQEWTLGERVVPKGKSLEELILVNKAVDEKNASEILEAVMAELEGQSSYPVLLAVDDVQSIFTTSSYIDPSYLPLESFSLAIPRLLLDFISGSKSFKSGSVLLSPSLLSPRRSPALTSFFKSQNAPVTHPSASVLHKLEPSVYAPLGNAFETYRGILEGVKVVQVPARLERDEAVGVVNMLKVQRRVREAVSDQAFLEKFLAADGNVREFRRSLEQNIQL